ncbi:MAG: pyruvate/2-oxoglutarate dehydrogenase complex dihydrolipoamide dehydrogenase (E3) component [Neolewinella sp.]|jgi:pyruvate/2-oxoglutarate dehydrogenase complex dihydrolipoamide dehydrogenase (E3) component
MDAEEVRNFGADKIILATGSLSDGTGRQRWLPSCETLPGIEHGNIWSPEEVMRREAKLGEQVLFIDEGGSWRGTGTAWHLAEKGHKITIVTPDPYVGKDLSRTTTDFPIRAALKKHGAIFHTECVVTKWHGDGATVRNMLDGAEVEVAASALILATTNRAFNDLELELTELNTETHTVGDCVAPRNAAYAFHEGRKLARLL